MATPTNFRFITTTTRDGAAALIGDPEFSRKVVFFEEKTGGCVVNFAGNIKTLYAASGNFLQRPEWNETTARADILLWNPTFATYILSKCEDNTATPNPESDEFWEVFSQPGDVLQFILDITQPFKGTPFPG